MSDQSESQGSNFDFWHDNSRQARRSLFKWDIFGSHKSTEPSSTSGTTSTTACSDTTTLAPPAGLPGHMWLSDPVETLSKVDDDMLDFSQTDRPGNLTPRICVSVPTPTRPAPSHNYPNLSQQLEDFLWSRKNSYAGTLSESIYDGDTKAVVDAVVSRKDSSARDLKKRFLSGKPYFTSNAFQAARNDDSDLDTWSLSSVIKDGKGGNGTLLLDKGAPGHFVVVQTTEITVEVE